MSTTADRYAAQRDAGLRPVDAFHNEQVLEWLADYRAWLAEGNNPPVPTPPEWVGRMRGRESVLVGRAAALFKIELGEA